MNMEICSPNYLNRIMVLMSPEKCVDLFTFFLVREIVDAFAVYINLLICYRNEFHTLNNLKLFETFMLVSMSQCDL